MKKNHTKSIFNKPIFWVFIGFSIGFLIIIVPLGIYTFLVHEMHVKYIEGDMLTEPTYYDDVQYEYTPPQTQRNYDYTPQSK